MINKYYPESYFEENYSKYRTDKLRHVLGNGHNYLSYYDIVLSDYRNDIKNVFEIGVKEGGSLLLWRDYFCADSVLGIDKNICKPKLKYLESEENIKYLQCDQNDFYNLNKLFNSIGNQDIIIDDGSHMVSHQQLCLSNLFQRINSNMFYIIEDVHTSNIKNECSRYNKYFEENYMEYKYSTKYIVDDVDTKMFKDSLIGVSGDMPFYNSDNIKNNIFMEEKDKKYLIENVKKIYKVYINGWSESIIFQHI